MKSEKTILPLLVIVAELSLFSTISSAGSVNGGKFDHVLKDRTILTRDPRVLGGGHLGNTERLGHIHEIYSPPNLELGRRLLKLEPIDMKATMLEVFGRDRATQLLAIYERGQSVLKKVGKMWELPDFLITDDLNVKRAKIERVKERAQNSDLSPSDLATLNQFIECFIESEAMFTLIKTESYYKGNRVEPYEHWEYGSNEKEQRDFIEKSKHMSFDEILESDYFRNSLYSDLFRFANNERNFFHTFSIPPHLTSGEYRTMIYEAQNFLNQNTSGASSKDTVELRDTLHNALQILGNEFNLQIYRQFTERLAQ